MLQLFMILEDKFKKFGIFYLICLFSIVYIRIKQ